MKVHTCFDHGSGMVYFPGPKAAGSPLTGLVLLIAEVYGMSGAVGGAVCARHRSEEDTNDYRQGHGCTALKKEEERVLTVCLGRELCAAKHGSSQVIAIRTASAVLRAGLGMSSFTL